MSNNWDSKAGKVLAKFHKEAASNKVKTVKVKSILEHFREMETDKELIRTLWEYWHTTKTALSGNDLKGGSYINARMSLTIKWMHEKYPEHSKAVYFKYLDRNIN